MSPGQALQVLARLRQAQADLAWQRSAQARQRHEHATASQAQCEAALAAAGRRPLGAVDPVLHRLQLNHWQHAMTDLSQARAACARTASQAQTAATALVRASGRQRSVERAAQDLRRAALRQDLLRQALDRPVSVSPRHEEGPC